ncbi:MAG TPA: hypothetical protein VN133_05250 [Humibacter sp.]|nr:hypothetical protein [Humibacter sp.]
MTIPTTWYDTTTARTDWGDAPASDDQLETLLTIAKNAVITYAPKYTDPTTAALSLGQIDPVTGLINPITDTIPPDYRQAQLMQARNTWNAAKVDPANASLGDDQFVIRPFPLDWMVKQIIRPKRALPWVG